MSAYGAAARWATPTPDRTRPTRAGPVAGDGEHQGAKPEHWLGATLGATQTNDLAILRTHADGGHGLTRGHELIRTGADTRTGIYGSVRLGVRVTPSAPGSAGRTSSGACVIYRQAPLARARIRKTMTSTAHSTATAAGVHTALPPTPGRRALVTATPPKQMAVRDAPIVSLETR
jgi:hypothetical protein